ncbi:Outer membrane receptor proteins, mostly Fe transport [Cyclobacterium xiamenense]|uniref:Outer membrane receptor proteins, mostly Fe transport n=1 Tax=Cyclobacterium xiamenense TaxID=1297121 RepID=A0A1H6XX57_9BACT|nr:outer membrane beta-barrel family protein [Cyclobacterium xiamenense]SEJ29165.1 Outer membrane receptor proteins, mostly Fe transport [Cyclobacterium xiamenense]
MKQIVLLVSLIFLSLTGTFAQEVLVKGKIQDSEQRTPLEFANVALLEPADSSLVFGGMSDLDGTFEFTGDPSTYLLRVGFIGYEDYYQEVNLEDRKTVNLGTISLAPGATNLDEVTVEGVTSMFETDIDKRRYDVENSIVAEGATATELLETLPSIQVDEEGGISMRGSGEVLIYINGRPSNLSGDDAESILAQFPANSIKSVELITNPSSRYDAAGVGGIINIILKKNQRTGFNGQANVAVGTRDKYNAGLNLNYGAEKINYFVSYSYQDRRTFRESEAYRVNFLPGVSPILDQYSYGESFDATHLVRGGLDYTLSDRKTLSFYMQGNFRDRTAGNELDQRNLNGDESLSNQVIRTEEDQRISTNLETGLSYDYRIDTAGQRLFASLSFSRDERTQTEFFQQDYFDESSQEVPGNFLSQINDRPQTSNLWIAQVDYEKPFDDGGRFEAGVKGTFSQWSRAQEFSQGDAASGFDPIRVDSISDGFDFKEDVYALYASYRNSLNKFGYQFGLRGEYTETISYQERLANTVVNNYGNLFPSLFLSYELGEEKSITANYSRRISRPSLWSLSPFYRVRDMQNFSIGNPYLQPELTDSYELGYANGWEKLLLNATVYHRYSTNVLTRVIRLTDDNLAIQTRENANFRKSTGLEVINQIQPLDWWDVTLSANFFYSEVFGENIEEGLSNSNFSWTVSLLSNMVIPDWFSIQIQGNYRGPIVFPQGEIEPLWGINAGIRRAVLNDKGTISLNVSDIFNTRVFKINNSDARFVQDRLFNWETQIGTLSFTYRFGGFKDRNNGREGGREFDGEDSDF